MIPMNNYAIILCGGSGTRFWPLSRNHRPKQLLNICSGKSMVSDTIQRVLPVVKSRNIYIATGKIHGPAIKKCLRRFGIPPQNYLFEPEGKNTLSSIAVLSDRIYSRDPKAVIAVLPSDHFVKDAGIFRKTLKRGFSVAGKGFIVTLGICPSRAETGYGYIKASARRLFPGSLRCYKVDKFIEKPDINKARKFFRDKKYYWNGGIFVFRADTAISEIKRFLPGVYRILSAMRTRKQFAAFWRRLPVISFDYAVMEKTDKAVVLPADYGWTDMGSWEALAGIIRPDARKNIFKGRCLDLGSRSTLVWSGKRLVATIGLDSIIVVDTPDAVLVCSRDRSQDVKKLVHLLERKRLKALL